MEYALNENRIARKTLRILAALAVVLVLSMLPAWAEGGVTFLYEMGENGAVITGIEGDVPSTVAVPDTLDGHYVAGIASNALAGVGTVELPQSVTEIAPDAFGAGAQATIRARHGSAALAWAEANGFDAEDISSGSFKPEVMDITGTQWQYEEGVLSLPSAQAAGIGENDLVFSDDAIDGDLAMGYRVTDVSDSNGVTFLTLEEAEGTDIFSAYHAEMHHQPLTITGASFDNANVNLSRSKGKRNEEPYTASFTYSPGKGISVHVSVTMSMFLDAAYDSNYGLPSGQGVLTNELHIKAHTTYEEGASYSRYEHMTDPDPLNGKPAEKAVDPLNVTFATAGPFSVVGSASINLDFAIMGNCDVTIVKKQGVIIDGTTYTKVDEPVKFVKNADVNISGWAGVGVSLDLSLKATGFGKIISFGGGGTIRISANKMDQYDDDIICYDLPITMELNLRVKFKLALEAGMFNYNFYEKTADFFRESWKIADFHMELSRNEHTYGRFTKLDFMDECSISPEKKVTFKFVTGTREQIGDRHTVVGQKVTRPNDPKAPNLRVRFLGWYYDMQGTRPFDFDLPVTRQGGDSTREETITLYAVWSEPYQKVTIDLGVEGRDPIVGWYIPGSLVNQPTMPMRMDYRFISFTYPRKLNGKYLTQNWDFAVNTVPFEDVTITGHWEYEEGFNPFQETIDAITEDQDRYNYMMSQFNFSPKLSTGVQAAIHPLTDDVLNNLSDVVHIIGYRGEDPVVVIPPKLAGRPVVYVDGSSFENKDKLVGLVFPTTVLAVTGFEDCPNLQYVVFQEGQYPFDEEKEIYFNGLRRICDGCFMNCPNLEAINFPSRLGIVDRNAFCNTGFHELTLPDGITWGSGVFASCANLDSVTLPQSMTCLENSMFCNCEKLDLISGLNHITTFRQYSLSNTGLTKLTISNVELLEDKALYNCKNLAFLRLRFSPEYEHPEYCRITDLPALEILEVHSGVFGLYEPNLPSLKLVEFHGYNNEAEDATPVAISFSGIPSLKTIELDVQLMGSVSLSHLPALEYFHMKEYWDSPFDQSGGMLYFSDCPKLTDWKIASCKCPNLDLRMFGLGLDRVDLSDFPGFSKLVISEMPNLDEVVLPDDIDMSVVTMKDNPLMLEQNWLSHSCFAVPADWPDTDQLNEEGILDEDRLRRLVFLGDTEIDTDDFGNAFVIVCDEDSPAYAYFNGRKQWDGLPYVVIPSVSPNADKLVVCFRVYNSSDVNLVDGESFGDDEENTLLMYFDKGDKLRLPKAVFAKEEESLDGWYYDKYFREPVPDDAVVTDDMVLYARAQQQSTDFSYEIVDEGAVLTGYAGSSARVVVPDFLGGRSVCAVASNAFSSEKITSITLPDSVRNLAGDAFAACPNLERIAVDSPAYRSVDGAVYAVDDSGAASELVLCPPGKSGKWALPEGVTTIAPGAAKNAAKLTEIVFPATLQSVGEDAFGGCLALERVHFADSCVLENNPFWGLHSIAFTGPVDAEDLAAWADDWGVDYNEYEVTFMADGLNAPFELRAGTPLDGWAPESPDGQRFIGWTADAEAQDPEILDAMPAAAVVLYPVWQDCFAGEGTVLTAVDESAGPDVVIGRKWTAIAGGAISFDATSVAIPDTVTEIDDDAFPATVERIIGDVGTAAEQWAIDHDVLFVQREYCLTFASNGGSAVKPILAYRGQIIEWPEPQRTWAAFEGWFMDEALTERVNFIEMPGYDVTAYAGWEVVPGRAMEFEWRMEEDGSATITGYAGVDPTPVVPDEINGCPVTAIAAHAFSGNQTLYRLDIPASVVEIGEWAFSNSDIHSLTLAADCATLGEGCFAGCACLQEINLPTAQDALPELAFCDCRNLVDVSLPDTVQRIGDGAFDGCESLVDLALPASLETFGPAVLGSARPVSVEVAPDSATLEGDGTLVCSADDTLLYGCRRLSVLEIPEGTCEIGQSALADTDRLQSVALPEGVTRIGAQAFQGSGVSEISLPDTLTAIGDHAFDGCKLVQVCLPASVTEVGEQIFGVNDIIAIYVNDIDSAVARKLMQDYTVIGADEPVPVTALTLTGPEALAYGETGRLETILEPAGATDARVSFWSTDSSVVSVDGNGVITAVGIGEAELVGCTPNDVWASCTVRVVCDETMPLKIILDDPDFIDLEGRQGMMYNTWHTFSIEGLDDSLIQVVSMCTGLEDEPVTQEGHYTLKVNSSDRDSMLVPLEVTVTLTDDSTVKAAAEVALAKTLWPTLPKMLTLHEGESWEFPADQEWSAGASYYISQGWDHLVSSNRDVVDADGYSLLAVAPGTATVRFPHTNGAMMVRVVPSACELTATIPDSLAFVGYETPMTVTCSDPDCQLVYKSDNASILTVDDTGVVTGKKRGVAHIAVQAVKNGEVLNEKCVLVTCVVPYYDVDVNHTFDYEIIDWSTHERIYKMNSGQTVDLLSYGQCAGGNCADARSVRLTSSDPSVIAIDGQMAEAVKLGVSTLTWEFLATGESTSVEVHVDVWDVEVILPESHEIYLKVNETRALPMVIDGDMSRIRTEYEVDGEGVRVEEDGRITGLSETGWDSVEVCARLFNASGINLESVTFYVNVVSDNYAERIDGFPEAITVAVGQSVQLVALESLYPADSCIKSDGVMSLDNDIATVERQMSYASDSYGVTGLSVQGQSEGETDLRVVLYNGQVYMCHVTVTAPELWVEIGGSDGFMVEGDQATLKAENVVCTHGYSLEWSAMGAVEITGSGAARGSRKGSGRVSLTITDNVTRQTYTAIKVFKVGSVLSGFKPVNSAYAETDRYYNAWTVPLQPAAAGDDPAELAARTTAVGDDAGCEYSVRYDNKGDYFGDDQLYLRIENKPSRPITVTLTTDNGTRAAATQSFKVYIDPNLSWIDLTIPTLAVGQTFDLRQGLSDDVPMDMTWGVKDESVATVDAAGILTARAEGWTTVTARFVDSDGSEVTGEAYVTVSGDMLTDIRVSDTEITMGWGNSWHLGVEWEPEYAACPVISINPDVVRVTGSGEDYQLTAVACGEAMIRVGGSEDGIEEWIHVIVVKRLDAIYWNIGLKLELHQGNTLQIRTATQPSDVPARWNYESSDESVVEIFGDGLIVAQGRGTAIIKAWPDNYDAPLVAMVTVSDPAWSPSLELYPDEAELRVNEWLALEAASDDDVNLAALSYSSSNPGVVQVVGSGVVKAVGTGTATVTARDPESGAKATATIRVSGTMSMFRLPQAMLEVCEGAFEGDTSIEAVVFPGGVQIGAGAFADCENLQYAFFEGDDVEIDGSAFDGCAPEFCIWCRKGGNVWRQAEACGWNHAALP